MQNSIYKIKYLLFLSWDWEAWCLAQSGGQYPPPERNTAWNKGQKCFHCLGAPNNLIRPWVTCCNSQQLSILQTQCLYKFVWLSEQAALFPLTKLTASCFNKYSDSLIRGWNAVFSYLWHDDVCFHVLMVRHLYICSSVRSF